MLYSFIPIRFISFLNVQLHPSQDRDGVDLAIMCCNGLYPPDKPQKLLLVLQLIRFNNRESIKPRKITTSREGQRMREAMKTRQQLSGGTLIKHLIQAQFQCCQRESSLGYRVGVRHKQRSSDYSLTNPRSFNP